MPKVGDAVKKVPFHALPEDGHRRTTPVEWTVRWVHPTGRYYVAEYPVPGGRTIRESFFQDIAPVPKTNKKGAWHMGI